MDLCVSLFQASTPHYKSSARDFHEITCDKSNSKATELKNEGNAMYKKKKFCESIALYTESLQHAEFNGEEYGIALANRSAVAFMLQRYSNCLDDIELCLLTKYPEKLRLKLHLRKAECLFYLSRNEVLAKYLEEITEIYDTDELGDKLSKLKDVNSDFKFRKLEITFPLASNEKFYGASRKIRVEYNKAKGRHVVANNDIKAGEILFVEKAYVFAPIPQSNVRNKCYNCLGDCPFSIPCKTCTVSIYCNETCRDESWIEYHKFECPGMALWYEYAIALPALKCIIKGARVGFPKPISHPSQCRDNFGNGYEYFVTLHDNLNKIPYASNMAMTANLVMDYLRKKTDFFEHFDIPSSSYASVGGALLKSMAIIKCNASLIEHCVTAVDVNNDSITNKTDLNVILEKEDPISVASGLFPSVSMMNHSCNTNVTMYYIMDTVIVKAKEDIRSGDEIYNCYGVDYRTVSKTQRLQSLLESHHFVCTCPVCSNEENEMYKHMFYITCPNCRSKLVLNVMLLQCKTCNTKIRAQKYGDLEKWYTRVYENNGILIELEECAKGLEKFFSPTHTYMNDLYRKLYEEYELLGDKIKSLEWYERYMDTIEKTFGPTSIQYLNRLDVHLHDCQPDCVFEVKKKSLLHYHFPVKELTLV